MARLAVIGMLVAAPGFAAQTWREKRVFFGDAHWHSCLSQDAKPWKTPPDEEEEHLATLPSQYESMLYDYQLDFSLQSDHAEAAEAGIIECEPYLHLVPNPFYDPFDPSSGPQYFDHSGEEIASAMKAAADEWNGREGVTIAGDRIEFVTFPGYEWAPDARCWGAGPTGEGDGLNTDDNTPGHINYFFSDTAGWTYHDDVWAPGNGDSDSCATATALGFAYYNGSKDWVDEILGQLIHQRDDPDRSYDLLIQYNHPAGTLDKGGSLEDAAKWFDFEHSAAQCSVAAGGAPCSERHCEALRRAYGLTFTEWYTNHEAYLGSTERHGGHGLTCADAAVECPQDLFSERCRLAREDCDHESFHLPDRYVTSRGLREGYMLASTGGSDSHSGRRSAPNGFPGARGAGSGSLTAVYASEATREAIWDGLTGRRTYALSRFREIGPVHKGRVDFFSPDPVGKEDPSTAAFAADVGDIGGAPTPEYVLGDLVETFPEGSARSFTISAAAEEGTTGVFPVELRLYRVGPTTPLSSENHLAYPWLDDVPGDPGKFGELIGSIFTNTTGSSTLSHTFENVVVRPGDAVFAVVPYSDYMWVDDFYDTDKEPLDADGDGVTDPGKSGYVHGDNNTWARTTPIFFHAAQERPTVTPSCAHVSFNGSGTAAPSADRGVDAGIPGDDAVLPVAIPGGYDLEWNRWRFSLSAPSQYVDLSFFTYKDEDDTGHLFAVRIDGRLVYSGRAGIDHDADALVDMKDIPFPLEKGLHQLEVHMDDQEHATGDNDPNFHCNDYDGPPAFLDAVAFHDAPAASCGDQTPPEITCPEGIERECSETGGVPASDPAVAAFLAGATATDDFDTTPTITHDAPDFFPNGTTVVTFTAEDDAGNVASCSAPVTVGDATPPQLGSFSLSPSTLAPPKHNLVSISVPTLVATDVCDASPAIRCSVTSSEPANGIGDGDQPVDIIFDGEPILTQGTGERQIATTDGRGTFTLQLRAERSGTGPGRTYMASCAGVDAGGNRGAARTATVVVPR